MSTPIGLSAIFVFPSKSNSFSHFLDRASWLMRNVPARMNHPADADPTVRP
jgi:hypothetical protein